MKLNQQVELKDIEKLLRELPRIQDKRNKKNIYKQIIARINKTT